MSIGIIDIGLCNLRSVEKAVWSLGHDVSCVREAHELDDVSHCILPGVGHFRTAMELLRDRGFESGLNKFAASGRPLLGICLGMQLLASKGEEGGLTSGLDLIAGRVRLLAPAGGLRVPHVGWNTVEVAKAHPLFAGIKPNRDFYFVHSYHFDARSPDSVLCETVYGTRFTSGVVLGNVAGVQFHPEKSQKNGVRLLENFCAWEPPC